MFFGGPGGIPFGMDDGGMPGMGGMRQHAAPAPLLPPLLRETRRDQNLEARVYRVVVAVKRVVSLTSLALTCARSCICWKIPIPAVARRCLRAARVPQARAR